MKPINHLEKKLFNQNMAIAVKEAELTQLKIDKLALQDSIRRLKNKPGIPIKVKITVSAYFYNVGENYKVKPELKWGCYVVDCKELTLIDERHAQVIGITKKQN